MSETNDFLFEHLGQPMVELDDSLRVLRYNRLFQSTFDPDPDAGPTPYLAEVLPDKLLETVVRMGLDSGELPGPTEFVWPPEGAERRHYLLSMSRVPPPAETALLAFYDVTEWKRHQLREMEASRLDSLGDMVAGVAHEINNPLAAIMGLSQLALRLDMAPDLRADVEKILDQATKAAEVVANLRLFGRVLKPSKHRIDIVPLVQMVLDKKADWFRASGITVTTKIGMYTLEVEGDQAQLEQAFINIITNAQQAISEGGGQSLDIEVDAANGMVRLSFGDDGPGIDQENLPRIFDPFFTTREVGKGSGLGLSMCYSIIREHGGTIMAESEPGVGTTIIVELPAAPTLPPGLTEPKREAASGKVKALVIDDEPVVLEFISRSLTNMGHDVDTATSGTEVVGRTDLDTYDVILLDMRMPGFGGEALFDHLRQLPGDIVSKVVFVTGDTASIDTQEFIERTGNPLLPKPFTLEQLNTIVASFARRNSDNGGSAATYST